jgi:L-lactate dehydrogenase complex protein LldG
MSARDNILGRIRRAQGRPGTEPTAAEMAQVREAIAHPAAGPLPARVGAPDAVLAFRGECDRVGTTHHEVHAMSEVPGAVAAWLEANELPRRVAGWHEFAALDWSAAGIAFDDRPANPTDPTGLTGCFCAISETGTLLLLSAPDAPKVTALLPDSHVAVVRRSRLVRTMEQAFALLRAERGQPPRATWFVSGPSRTADIEQTVVVGAHGPYRAHVIIVP